MPPLCPRRPPRPRPRLGLGAGQLPAEHRGTVPPRHLRLQRTECRTAATISRDLLPSAVCAAAVLHAAYLSCEAQQQQQQQQQQGLSVCRALCRRAVGLQRGAFLSPVFGMCLRAYRYVAGLLQAAGCCGLLKPCGLLQRAAAAETGPVVFRAQTPRCRPRCLPSQSARGSVATPAWCGSTTVPQ